MADANIAQVLRDTVKRWADTAPIQEVLAFVGGLVKPSAAPSKPSPASEAAAGKARPAAPRASRRVLTKARRRVTREDAEKIKATLASVKPGTKEYGKARDQLSRELGLARRQIAGVLRGGPKRKK